MNALIPYEYIYSGTLSIDSPTYTKRKADTELYESLKAGKFCYVFNSRKTGKSSLRVQIMHRLLSEGIACAAIDLSMISTSFVTPHQWYADFIDTLIEKFNLDIDLESWWLEQELLSPVKRFSKFIDILLVQSQNNNRNLVIFIDEIDSVLSLDFDVDDFFALIRACHNQRADNSIYNYLTFCLLGVTTPSNLIAEKTRTPFNIGQAIELRGFTIEEAKSSLMTGLARKMKNPEVVLQQILNWTGGQPFLTQKLCHYLVHSETKPQENGEAQWVEQIVQSKIIHNWICQDEPEYLRTILNRIISDKNEKYRISLLELYQRILLSTSKNNMHQVVVDESVSLTELQLSGLIVEKNAILKVYNRIYELIFDWNWTEKELAKLRPYANFLTAWFDSNCKDELCLLRGQALKDATTWATGKSLGARDYQFLSASETLEKLQANIAYEQETERKGAEILREATKTANRRLRIGSIILVSSFLLLLLSLFKVRQTELQSQNALKAIQLEETSTILLNNYKSESNIDGLLLAMRNGRELKSIVKYSQSLADYRVYSPVFSLQMILSNIREKNRLEGHQNTIKSVVYSPDGTMLASASADGSVKLWNSTTGKQIKTLTQNENGLTRVVFSPDGKILAFVSNNNTVRLWDVAIGKPTFTLTGHQSKVNNITYSPDGKTLATASNDNTIKLWDVATTKLISTLTGHTSKVNNVTYSPDGKILASTSNDNTIKLWDINTGKQISILNRRTDYVTNIVFSPDSKTLASTSDDNNIKLWNINTDQLTYTLFPHSGVTSVAISPDGKTLASAGLDNSIKFWNLGTHELIDTLGKHNLGVTSIAFSPDGKTLVSASDDKTIKMWSVTTAIQASTPSTYKQDASNGANSPTGKIFASVTSDNNIKVWNGATGKLISTLIGHLDQVNTVAISPDGKIIATASDDKTIKLWNGATGKQIFSLTRYKDVVTNIVFSRDGKTLTFTNADGTVKLWNLDLNSLLVQGCSWLKDYLVTRPNVAKELCPTK